MLISGLASSRWNYAILNIHSMNSSMVSARSVEIVDAMNFHTGLYIMYMSCNRKKEIIGHAVYYTKIR